MSTTILTLFGEEIVPEQMKAVGRKKAEPKEPAEPKKPRGRKKKGEEPETAQEEAVATEAPVANTAAEMEAEVVHEEQEETPVAATPEEQAEKAVTKAKEPKTDKVKPDQAAKWDKFADWDGDKKYYTIGEVAKIFDVRTSNIRYWTNEFALKVRTTRKGDRLYTPEQIKEIRTIYHLVKVRGFTISGAKTKLKSGKKASVQSVDLKDSLLQLRNKLVQLKNSIK